MTRIWHYVSLHFRLQTEPDQKGDKKGRATTAIIALITAAIMLGLMKYFFDMMVNQLGDVVASADFSAVIFTVMEILLTIVGVSFEIKCLLKPFDAKITARFPMSSFQMFVAELVMVYVYLQVLSTVGYFAIMTIFGWSAHLFSIKFLLRTLLMSLFAPMLPFAVATVLAVPVMYLLSVLENHNVIKLILFILMLAAAFLLYNYVLDLLAEYFIHQKVADDTKATLSGIVGAFNGKFNPATLLKNIVFGQSLALSYGVTVGASAVILAIGLAIAKPVYDKVRLQTLEGRGKFFKKQTKFTSESAFWAIIKKEGKDILRTNTYAYFYLGVAITTPVMVYFCSRLVNKVGSAEIGLGVSYGVCVLVLVAFMAMINSFSATAISRENLTFYITKTAPISARKQLFAKGILNFVVAVGALLVSATIMITLEFLPIEQIGVVFATSLISSVGLIARGFNVNLKYPCLQSTTSGEISETNVTRMLFVGILLCILEGGGSLVLSFLTDVVYVYVLDLTVATVFASVEVIKFMKNANKKYYNIEYR